MCLVAGRRGLTGHDCTGNFAITSLRLFLAGHGPSSSCWTRSRCRPCPARRWSAARPPWAWAADPWPRPQRRQRRRQLERWWTGPRTAGRRRALATADRPRCSAAAPRAAAWGCADCWPRPAPRPPSPAATAGPVPVTLSSTVTSGQRTRRGRMHAPRGFAAHLLAQAAEDGAQDGRIGQRGGGAAPALVPGGDDAADHRHACRFKQRLRAGCKGEQKARVRVWGGRRQGARTREGQGPRGTAGEKGQRRACPCARSLRVFPGPLSCSGRGGGIPRGRRPRSPTSSSLPARARWSGRT